MRDYTGEKNPMWGRYHTNASKKLMSNRKKGEKSPFWGKHHSQETKEKISQALIGIVRSPETRKKMSIGKKGMHYKRRILDEACLKKN